MPAGALADGDSLGSWSQKKYLFRYQGIVKHDVSLAEQPGRAQREEVTRARPGADEIDDTGQGVPLRFHPERRRNSGTGRFTEAW